MPINGFPTFEEAPPYWLADHIEISQAKAGEFKFSAVKNGKSSDLDKGEIDGLVLVSKNKHSIGDGMSWPDSSIVPRFNNGSYSIKVTNGVEPQTGDKFSILGKASESAKV